MANTDIGKAYVQIVPSAKGISGSISSLLGGEASSAGSSAGETFGSKMLSTLKGVLVGGAITKAMSSMVSIGATMEQAVGGIQTIFEGADGYMLNYAQEAYRTAGISANEYMEQATSFGASLVASLGGDTKKAAESANQALIDMADNANKMGTPIESLQNAYQGFAKQNYTMLDNLKLGYGGTKTEMQRLLADAQKITGVKYDMSNLADVYSAIHVIQEEIGITGTTAEEANSTISGSLASMKSAFSNLIGNIATGSGDYEDSLYALFDTTKTFLFDNLLPMIGDILGTLPEVLSTTILEGVPTFLENGRQIIFNLAQGFVEGFPTMADSILTLIETMTNSFLENLPTIAHQGVEMLMSIGQSIIENLPMIVERGVDIVNNLISGILGMLPQLFTDIYNGVKKIDWWSIGKAIIDGIIKGVKDLIGTLVDTVVGAAKKAWNGVKDFLGIHSPSRKFMFIGENMALGLGVGFADAMPSVLDEFNKQTRQLTNDVVADMNATYSPTQSKKINNLEINFAINNEGKDITDNDVERWSSLLADSINEKLGFQM